ncbi:hypothetical protein VNI00_000098 [Paramarasmius palmivorus]|uniref:non-specific serine/threonine protein kinase n=1 Tax=Paramarasmius palmivorus TaxID=297713 RepID=A0AAW0EF08_9AGAR
MPRALHILPDFEGCMLGNGDYHIARYIASGGYGKVYSALKVSSSTSVAIKCLRKPVQHSREGEFLMHELSLHQRVSGHPNIVSIHEIIETDSYVFVVLDLCEDGDLHSAIERRAFDRNDEAIRTVFVQLLNAVEHCHDSGVYHRDLKPENIMCSEDHQIRLADFGLSTDKDVCSDGECGSEYYMSPECLESKDGTSYHAVHNDIWALGIILLNILTGLNPWRSASLSDPSYRKYVHSPTSHLRNHYSMLSEDVLRILGQMLCSEPHSRIGIPALRMEIQRLCTFYSAKDLTDGF